MSRKFSNKKVIKPKAKPQKGKKPKPQSATASNISPLQFPGGKNLFLIMSNTNNKQYNIDSTVDTWLKNLSKDDDYVFLTEKPLKKIRNFTFEVSSKYINTHDSYSNEILLRFLKNVIPNISNKYKNICFCTDTTYINTKTFNNGNAHWGYVSSMLPTSIEALKEVNPRISPEEVRMYHGEAGFCLSSNIVEGISKFISKNDNLVLDRWDATIGYCMHRLGAKLNHDQDVNLFPHTVLNHSSKEIVQSKSYGYAKFYDKKNIFDTLNASR